MIIAICGGILILLLGGMVSMPWWIDRGGTYDQTASLTDVDGDGDLDMILNVARTESPGTVWAGIHLWTNTGGGQLTPSEPGIGGPSSAVGDVDLDGDPDLLIVEWDYIRLWLNQGGTQAGQTGQFSQNNPIHPTEDRGVPGSILLGDLNDNGQFDGFVAGCCEPNWQSIYGIGKTIPKSWVWLNAWNPGGWLDRQTLTLSALDGKDIKAAALGDLDGDSDLDVFAGILQSQAGTDGSGADLILWNDGSGNFSDSGQRLSDGDSVSIALGDLDGDGDLDALVGTESGALLWTNQGGVQGDQEGVFVFSGNLRLRASGLTRFSWQILTLMATQMLSWLVNARPGCGGMTARLAFRTPVRASATPSVTDWRSAT